MPDLSQVYLFHLENSVDVLHAIEAVYEHGAVLYAEPNFIDFEKCSEPNVWGVGHGTIGWSASNPNYQSGYCVVDPQSVSETGCQLLTYVYKVYNPITMQFLGWYPCEPESISLNYRVWGQLADPKRFPDGGKHDDLLLNRSYTLNYPNPFNSSTSIMFEISENSNVELRIFNLLGQEVTVLINREFDRGSYSIPWNGMDGKGNGMPSGIYFYKLRCNERMIIRKMILLK